MACGGVQKQAERGSRDLHVAGSPHRTPLGDTHLSHMAAQSLGIIFRRHLEHSQKMGWNDCSLYSRQAAEFSAISTKWFFNRDLYYVHLCFMQPLIYVLVREYY